MIPRSGLNTDAARAPTTAAGAVGDEGADRRGTSDGRYMLVRELARGGMGRIWIADDARLSRRVAIKELLEASGTRGARFERELSLTSIVSIQSGPSSNPGWTERASELRKLVTTCCKRARK